MKDIKTLEELFSCDFDEEFYITISKKFTALDIAQFFNKITFKGFNLVLSEIEIDGSYTYYFESENGKLIVTYSYYRLCDDELIITFKNKQRI